MRFCANEQATSRLLLAKGGLITSSYAIAMSFSAIGQQP